MSNIIVQSPTTATGIRPGQWFMITPDTYTELTTAGYLNVSAAGYNFSPNDTIFTSYNKGANFGIFIVSISAGQITLTEYSGTGGVVFPVVSGDFAVFDGTAGLIKDAGYAPSNAAKTTVVMANGTVIANHIGCFKDTTGTLGIDSATAINGGNIQAGLSGTAGSLASYPATASKGSLSVTAVANTGNTATVISNAAMGQASTISIPDPGASTANFLLNSGIQSMAAGSAIQFDKGTGTESSNAVTINAQSGVITSSSLTVAGGATYVITLTNSEIATTSVVLLQWLGGTNTTANFTMSCAITLHTATITIHNNTAATNISGTILIGFTVL